ncbi:MAG: hypothetical protein AAF802_30125 [Planctomycetota bacterium]
MKHREPALLLCVLGVFLSWFLPTIVRAIHEAHGMATAHEFHSYRLIDQERLEAVRTEYHIPNYSVEQRIRAVGGVHIYLPIVTGILATIFGALGILVWMSPPDSNSGVTSTRYDRGEPDDARESPS